MSPQAGSEGLRRRSLGQAGESVARKHLERQGFRILRTNYRQKGGEIDIVAYGGRTVVFCEVKSRIGAGEAVERYGERQRRRMIQISEAFLREFEDLLPKVFDLRYDLIVVGEGAGGVLEVKEHLADAFRP